MVTVMGKPTRPDMTLHMIGNSHIDPVWYWTWEEGLQAVKSTFASALERMREYPDFIFTTTSAAFFAWIERIQPDMFREIQQRVAEGRWELTGGWFVEPDCIIPSGEAFVRQGLYSQRFFMSRFGRICHIGSNVDSFGHGHNLPMLLAKCRMHSYVFMRPRLPQPVFNWRAEDGSTVTALSLPGEYTTWFATSTRANIELTLGKTTGFTDMACCYGVGNHGGGPTKENIETILALKHDYPYPGVSLQFSTYRRFFQQVDKRNLPLQEGAFEGWNTGCYTNDLEFKRINRLAEKRLLETDTLLSLAAAVAGSWPLDTRHIQPLWERLLFNQFHDTLCGTAIKSARDEALMQISAVASEASCVKNLAVQAIVGRVETRGEGFPLFLFNPQGYPYTNTVEIELEWFCTTPLRVLDPSGSEVAYQQLFTDSKATHFNIGGRRRIVFYAHIPALGFAVYRLLELEPTVEPGKSTAASMQADNEGFCLQNSHVKAEIDPQSGRLVQLTDLHTGFCALNSPLEARVWIDQRDTWGHDQGTIHQDTGESFLMESIEWIERGPVRQTVRVRSRHGSSHLEQRFSLHVDDTSIIVAQDLFWDKPWHQLRLVLPTTLSQPLSRAESLYGTFHRDTMADFEYYMHRWLDVSDHTSGAGLLVTNTNTHAFLMNSQNLELTILRSPIFAQHKSTAWHNPLESYQHANLGEHHFTLSLHPHGGSLTNHQAHRLADLIATPYTYLCDNRHAGPLSLNEYSFAQVDTDSVRIELVKKAEDDDDFVFRVWETEGVDTLATLTCLGVDYRINIPAHTVETFKLDIHTQLMVRVDLLEWPPETALENYGGTYGT
jgi:alpha-mannosidase